MKAVRLPGNSHRTVVIGRTGTGKTTAGLWHLSLKNFKKFPWIIFDAKGDELITEIADIPGVEHIGFGDLPKHPGLYYLRATPPAMKGPYMERLLWKIHSKGKTGLFFDEGYVLDPRSDALNTIYTQGRALQLPTITLTQRPSWLSLFTFSEADFFQIFQLTYSEDRKRVRQYVPYDIDAPLPERHSFWYDVGHNDLRVFRPVPPPEIILENFETQLRRPKRLI